LFVVVILKNLIFSVSLFSRSTLGVSKCNISGLLCATAEDKKAC